MERNSHLASVAEHIIAYNGFSSSCKVLNQDARSLAGTRREGDQPHSADILVFEVRAHTSDSPCQLLLKIQ